MTLRRIDSAVQTFGELVALERFSVHTADMNGSTAIMTREKPRNAAVRARVPTPVQSSCPLRGHRRLVPPRSGSRDMPWDYTGPLRLELAEDGLLQGRLDPPQSGYSTRLGRYYPGVVGTVWGRALMRYIHVPASSTQSSCSSSGHDEPGPR